MITERESGDSIGNKTCILFSETVLRHHRSAFTAGQLLGDNNAWAVKGIILQCTDLMSKSWDIPLKIPVFARIAS